MNYLAWAEEYYRDAENLMKTIRKYEKMLNTQKGKNLEKLNSLLASYRNIYYDVLNTGRLLEERYKEQHNAA